MSANPRRPDSSVKPASLVPAFGGPATGLACLFLWLAGALAVPAATIPEPDTIFYGRILNYDHGHELLVTDGKLEWTIQPQGNGGVVYRLTTALESLADGAFSYRLKVPHEALVSGLSAADITPASIPMANGDVRYNHSIIRVNGELARILPPAADVFNASSGRRAAAYRLDLQIAAPLPASDGNDLPDWWQLKYFGRLGVDPNADPDHDGWSNLREYIAGSNPVSPNTSPVIALDNLTLDEGATEMLALRAVDSDTAAAQLVYSLVQEPQGASIRLLFGATVPGSNGKLGDKQLHAGDTFTQAQVNEGRLTVSHDNPATNIVTIGLSLADGSTNHPPFQTNFLVRIRKPSADDGSGAAVWFDAREASVGSGGGGLTNWSDRSGPKPWRDGSTASFNGYAGYLPLSITNQGPLGQAVVGMNAPGVTLPPVPPGQPPRQFLALPGAAQASVFQPGEITVFAVVNPQGNGHDRQQIVSGANFQLAMAGAEDNGRGNQVRFASEGVGVTYSNRRLDNQWALVTAWQEQRQLALELNGGWVGGPHPLDEAISLGSNPSVGVKDTLGQYAEPFQGYLAELLVFNRNLEDAQRQRINCALLSKWFGWVILDGSEEERNLDWRVPTSGLTTQEYQTNFVPLYGPDRHYILIGGGGHDTLRGGMNDDIIIGGRQADTMSGGGGSDRFVFNHAHINHGLDTITDFSPASDKDVIDIADLLRGSSNDLRYYLRLRTDGHDSYLDIDFLGAGNYTNHTIVLSNIVLRDDDRYSLWANGNLLTGDKRFPLTGSLSVVQATATEITSEPAEIKVRFSGGTSLPVGLELPFVLGGAGVRGMDYNLSIQRYNDDSGVYDWERVAGNALFVKVKPGDLDFAIRIEPVQNNKADPARNVQLTLTPLPELYNAPAAPVTVQIVDGPQRVWVTAPVNQATPGGSNGLYQVSRQGSLDLPLDVSVLMAGPAVNGIDYAYIPSVIHFVPGQSNAPVSLNALFDNTVKPAVVSEMVLQSGLGYLIDPADQSATVTIAASVPIITVEAYEPLAVQSDGVQGAFLARRQGPNSGALTVMLNVGGTALMGRDYQRLNTWVVFSPGATMVLLPVIPLSGLALDGVKTIDLSLSPDSSYQFGASSNAQVRLVGSVTSFARWKSSLFPASTTPPDAFGMQDSDGDGLLNVLEYAFGFDPKTPDANKPGLPRTLIQNSRLAVTFTRPIAAKDVDYVIETSIDLKAWMPVTSDFVKESSLLQSNGNEWVTFVDHGNMSAQFSHRFLRVRVQLR